MSKRVVKIHLLCLTAICVAAVMTASCGGGCHVGKCFREGRRSGALESAARPLLTRLDSTLALLQETDPESPDFGGLYCPACGEYHSRAAEALFPFAYEYSRSEDKEMLRRCKELAAWLIGRQEESGAWRETPGDWTGTTTDQLHSLLLAYPLVKKQLDSGEKDAWTQAIRKAADYLTEVMDNDFAYINYCASSACSLAEAWKLLKDTKYREKAVELARLCIGKINSDGLPEGEGENFGDGKTGVDIGYNMDMSLWGLARYAQILGDAEVMEAVRSSARKHLAFVFPDGSLDCSAGVRGCKWALWGSLTADGALPLYAILGSEDPVWLTAAVRNIALVERCIGKDGLIAPGPDYDAVRNEPPCIYATFAKAKSLAMALLWLSKDSTGLPPLPCDSDFEAFYPSIGTAVVRKGAFCTSVTASGYKSPKGAVSRFMHRPGGGSVGLMYCEGFGTVQAASQNEYHRWEGIHFPEMEGLGATGSRIEYGGYSSLYDYDAAITREGEFRYCVEGSLRNRDSEECGIRYKIDYYFTDEGVDKCYTISSDKPCEVSIVEPVIDAEGPVRQLFPAVRATNNEWRIPASAEPVVINLQFRLEDGAIRILQRGSY